MADWCQWKCWRREREKKKGLQFTHVFVLEPALSLSALRHNWPKYLSFGELYRLKFWGSGATAVCFNTAVKMRKYCRLPTAMLCVLLPLSLSLIQRGREGRSVGYRHVFLLSLFFQSFSHLWNSDSKKRSLDQEEEGEEQISTMWQWDKQPCTVWMRVIVFIMITQHKPLLSKMQVSALCSQDSGFQRGLTWERHVCLWFVGQTQLFHCILKLNTTAM